MRAPDRFETPFGPARVHLRSVEDARAALVLGHGAGGGVEASDLTAATEAALSNALALLHPSQEAQSRLYLRLENRGAFQFRMRDRSPALKGSQSTFAHPARD
jgi:hypothetical protein